MGANAAKDPELQEFWRQFKEQNQKNAGRLKELIASHVKKDCFSGNDFLKESIKHCHVAAFKESMDKSHGPEPEMISHENICVLNASGHDTHLHLYIFDKDREQVERNH